MKRRIVFLALFYAACRNDPAPATTSTSASPAVPSGQTSTAPLVPAAPSVEAPPTATSTAASAKTEAEKAYCVSATQSMEIAKPHQGAAPPYATCAAGIFSHCGGGDGKRGHLCSRPLDPKATALARKTQPDVCCYGSD